MQFTYNNLLLQCRCARGQLQICGNTQRFLHREQREHLEVLSYIRRHFSKGKQIPRLSIEQKLARNATDSAE